MKCFIQEEKKNFHYTVRYMDTPRKGGSSLGDLYFWPGKSCSVRFYGWSVGIPLEDLAEILKEIQTLRETVMGKGT